MGLAPAAAPRDLDFALLDTRDEYAQYFNLLSTVFSRLLACYGAQAAADTYEAGIAPAYLQKLLFSIDCLRMKYTYSSAEQRGLWVDLTESGFPNSMELGNLATDLEQRQERLRLLAAPPALKRSALDHLLQRKADPHDILSQLGERTYFDMLDPEKLFLPFTPGDLHRRTSGETVRSYVFSWACYDFQTNRPYVHVMTFDQDNGEQPLDQQGASYRQFLEVIRAEGSRAPDVGILALAVDDALESIHPKILKRLCIGPLYARLIMEKSPPAAEDERLTALCNLIQGHCRQLNDFVLFFSDEIIFSKSQKVTRTLLSPKGKVREIFAITETDPECYARRASVVHQNVLLPHGLLQHIAPEVEAAIPEITHCRKATYDEKGAVVIHG